MKAAPVPMPLQPAADDVGGGAEADAHAADGVAYAHGGGGGDGEGHHEGGAGALQRDFVAGERESAKGGDECGDEGEDGDLDEDGGAGGRAEEEEFAEVLVLDAHQPRGALVEDLLDLYGGAVAEACEEAVVVVAVGTPDGEDEDGHEVEAGEAGGPGGAGDTEGGDAIAAPGDIPVVAEDQKPVHSRVDEVGGDEGEGDGAAVVVGLQVAAEGEVEQQGEGAVVEALHGGDGLGEDRAVDGQVEEERMGVTAKQGDEQGREGEGHDEAVEEPAVGFLLFFGAEGLGDQGIEAKEDATDAVSKRC